MYELVAVLSDGREAITASGPNPTVVRARHVGISRSGPLVRRIVLRDAAGPLETLYCADWPADSGGGRDFA